MIKHTKKIIVLLSIGLLSIGLLFLFSGNDKDYDLSHMFQQVEKLKINRHGYVLGAILNPGQIKKAESNRVDDSSEGTYKFKDKNLFIVAHKTSNRILVIYEQFENETQQKIQDLVGDLYMNFDDPTVMSHDKVVYWAYTKEGKVTSKEFDDSKKDKKKLNILAKVKFISDINIMGQIKEAAPGHGYYIISSDPVLELFKNQNG